MRQYWRSPIGPFHTADGAPYVSSSTIADVSTSPQITIPANTLEAGMRIQLDALITFSNTATPTLILGFYYGGVAGTALAATSAITTTTGAASWPIIMSYRGKVVSVGTSGSIYGQGWIKLGTSLTAFTLRPIPETAAARTVTVDTTAAKAITVGATWGTNSSSNTLTCNEFDFDLLN